MRSSSMKSPRNASPSCPPAHRARPDGGHIEYLANSSSADIKRAGDLFFGRFALRSSVGARSPAHAGDRFADMDRQANRAALVEIARVMAWRIHHVA